MGFKRLRPRPWPYKQDEEVRKKYKENLKLLLNNPEIEIWYQDECGVQGDTKPRLMWAKKGSRLKHSYMGAHIKENVIGAVRPSDGKFISLIMPEVNTDTFQIFLDHINEEIGDKKIIMIMDNATWHKAVKLNWGSIEPLYLPAYSPDFNPIERIWLNLKNKFFTSFVAKSYDELREQLVEGLRYFYFNPEVCRSICTVKSH